MLTLRQFRLVSGLAAALAFTGCGGGTDSADDTGPTGPTTAPALAGANLGDPIPGLSPAELAAYERGRIQFSRRFKPSEGLGPFYNATSCASCHSTPVPGGSSQLYRNFYICMIFGVGVQDKLDDLPSPIVPAFGSGNWGGIFPAHDNATFTLEGERIPLPDPKTFPFDITTAQRNAIPIFGTGLFEFVTNATIVANADPNDSDGDGISGRYNTDGGDVGRFGVKAQVNNVEVFTRAPLQNQMGVTSNPVLGKGSIVSSSLAPLQGSTDPNDPTTDNDGIPDPEISFEDLSDLITFTRFIAPPAQKPFTAAALNGQLQFDAIGCASCHLPSIESTKGTLDAYTDLLIHYMGPELSDGLSFGMPQLSTIDPPLTTATEFRTQPLWGVSMSSPYLHDGRAETLTEAIEMHGGEAQAARDAFVALTDVERAEIIEFLEKL